MDRLQARAVTKLLAFSVQLVKVEVADASVRYTQYGEPGPRPAQSYLQGADGAVLHVRSINLAPQGGGGAAAAVQAPAAAAAAASAAGMAAGTAEAPANSTAAAEAAAAAAAQAAATAAEQLPWWQSMLQVPQLLWAHVVTDSPSATRLGIAGVSLTLVTYPTTWRGFQAAQEAAARLQQPDPFSFTPGLFATAAGGPRGQGAPAGTAARKRRRPLVTVQRLPRDQAAAMSLPTQGPWQPPLPGEVPVPGVAQQQEQHGGSSNAGIDYRGLLHPVAAEEHIVFRQWEVSVVVCLLPPGYAAAQEAAGASAPRPPAGRPTGTRSSEGGMLGRTPLRGLRTPTPSAQPRPSPQPVEQPRGREEPDTPPLERGMGSFGSMQLAPGLVAADAEDSLIFQEGDAPEAGGGGSGLAARPVLDRSSMQAEQVTLVTAAERAYFRDGLAGRRGDLASTNLQQVPSTGRGSVSRGAAAPGGQPLGQGLPAIQENGVNGHMEAAEPPGSVGPSQPGHQPGEPLPMAAGSTASGASPAPAGSPSGSPDKGQQQAGAGAGAAPSLPPLSRTSSQASAATSGIGVALLDVAVTLKALIPEFSAASVAIVNR